MGQQQLLLVILGVIIVGIAVAVGIWLFSTTTVGSNRDAIINDLMNLSQYAYRYRLRPEPLGGGGRRYQGFSIPDKLAKNDNATFSANVQVNSVTFTAVSALGFGDITVTLDSAGALGTYSYTGEFQ